MQVPLVVKRNNDLVSTRNMLLMMTTHTLGKASYYVFKGKFINVAFQPCVTLAVHLFSS